MAHAQKPDFIFPRNGWVHLNWWGRQFSRLLAAKVCASAWVMLDRPRSEVAWEYWLPTLFASFPFTSPPMHHHVPPGSEQALQTPEPVYKLQWKQCLAPTSNKTVFHSFNPLHTNYPIMLSQLEDFCVTYRLNTDAIRTAMADRQKFRTTSGLQ